jgi:hypothetical protein
MHRGIQQVQDIWSQETHSFLTWNEARTKFNLEPVDYPRYNRITASMPRNWFLWLTRDMDSTQAGDFVGIFDHEESHFPRIIFQATKEYKPSLTRQ